MRIEAIENGKITLRLAPGELGDGFPEEHLRETLAIERDDDGVRLAEIPFFIGLGFDDVIRAGDFGEAVVVREGAWSTVLLTPHRAEERIYKTIDQNSSKAWPWCRTEARAHTELGRLYAVAVPRGRLDEFCALIAEGVGAPYYFWTFDVVCDRDAVRSKRKSPAIKRGWFGERAAD